MCREWLLLLLVVLAATSRSSAQEECLYEYIEQPPTTLSCNPYSSTRLSIRCQVRVPAGSGVAIQWLKKNFVVQDMEIEIADNENKYDIESNSNAGGDVLLSRLAIESLNDTDAGMYQCVMVFANSSRLQPSQALILAIRDTYREQAACGTTTHVAMENSCATIPDTVDASQATSAATTDEEEGRGSSPEPTTPSSGSSLETALYVVVAVIVLFVLVIVSLAVTVVVLYRRRSRRSRATGKANNQGLNAYDGLHRSLDNSICVNDVAKQPSESSSRPSHREVSPPPPPTSMSHDPSQTDVYNHLIREVPANFSPNNFNQSEYSQLGPHSETTPPTVPLPPLSTTVPPPQRLAKPPMKPPSPHSPTAAELPASIYRTLEESGEEGGEATEQQPPSESKSSNTQQRPRPAKTSSSSSTATPTGKKSPDKTLFDDPEYSPLKTVQSRVQQLREPQYLGDYERDPSYIPPTAAARMSAVDPKYRGDYEWDPSYLPKPPPRRHSTDARPPPRRGGGNQEPSSSVNYKGDYERDPSYLPPSLRSGGKQPLVPKYSGDYERDPSYMAHKLSGSNKTTSLEYSYPSFPEDELVPPHIPHDYQALTDVLKDPPQQYARLNSAEPVDVTENEA